MREIVEQHTGNAPCLFLQGASGDLSPREQYAGDVTIAEANGRRLGFAALAVIESMLPPRTALRYGGVVESGAPLATWDRVAFEPPDGLETACFEIAMPLKKLPSESELRQELDACIDRVVAERLRRKLRVISHVGSGPTCATPAWIWRVGRSIIVGQPNEAYSLLQQALRRRYPDHAVIVMNLVNGSCGYLYPPELADRDIYQVWQSPFDRNALPALIDGCQRVIDRMISGSTATP
jgi:hypothetical protein